MKQLLQAGHTVIVALTVVTLTSCAPRLPRWTPWTRTTTSYGVIHTVRSGETLSGIARRYDVSTEALARHNGLRNPNRIMVGQRLIIPRRDAIARLYRSPRPSARVKPTPASVRRLSTPFLWPVRGTVTRTFSDNATDPHKGVDIAAPSGTPIRAVGSGEVLFSGVGPEGYGLIVIVEHDNRFVTVYAHNRANTVRVGQRVARGQRIAYVGNSGNATGPHLHFEVRYGADPRDPLTVLPNGKSR